MKKQILKLSILLLMLLPLQKIAGQDVIIMGSAALVSDIEDLPRFFYDPGGIPGTPGDNMDPNGYYAQGLRDTITLRTSYNGQNMYVLFEEFAMDEGFRPTS